MPYLHILCFQCLFLYKSNSPPADGFEYLISSCNFTQPKPTYVPAVVMALNYKYEKLNSK